MEAFAGVGEGLGLFAYVEGERFEGGEVEFGEEFFLVHVHAVR